MLFGYSAAMWLYIRCNVRFWMFEMTENPALSYVCINLQKTLDKTYEHCYNNHRCHEHDNKMRQNRSLKTIQRSKSSNKEQSDF